MLHQSIETSSPIYGPHRSESDVSHLIEAHSQLVRRVAWHVHSRMATSVDIADLIQIGMIALVEAARTFEDRGTPFAPYAVMRVRGAMIDEFRRTANMSRAGMPNRRKIAAMRSKLEAQLMRTPTATEMAEAFDMTLGAYKAMEDTTHCWEQESLHDVYSDSSSWFEDQSASAHTELEQSEMAAALAENISQLDSREATILQLYFVEEMNLHEIGEAMDIGAARVCQLKKRALEKLKSKMTGWKPE